MTEATHDDVTEEATDRRGMFKRLGVVAAGAAAVSMLDIGDAHAADGGNVVLGQVNTETNATTISSSSSPSLVLFVNDNTGYVPDDANFPAALGAWSSSRPGVYGYTDSTTSPAGIFDNGSNSAPDLQLGYNSNGRIRIWPTSAPTGNGAVGDVIVDSNGDLNVCHVAGSPGTYQRVPSVRSGYTGGVQHLLSSPIRVFDSRYAANSHGNYAGGTGAFANGSTHNIQVCNLTFQSVTIPAGVAGVFGNVTAVSPSSAGYLSLYPAGGTRPTPSTVNFAKGTTVANSFTAKVGTSSSIAVYAFGTTGVIVDIVGFIA